MKTAKAAVLEEVGKPLVLREFPLPLPENSEVLVEVIACTICGSDLHTLHGRRAAPLPTILGHEILGRVAAFGPRAAAFDAQGRPLAIGDRVTWSIVASCGDCFYCDRGLPQKCLSQMKYGHEPLHRPRALTGGLADHCLLRAGTAIFRVPSDLCDAVACPANCATATIAAAMEAAGPVEGQSILVMGAGMLGVTAIAWSRWLGASAVIACDETLERLELASRFGATRVCSPAALPAAVGESTAERGVDVVFELTGSPDAFEAAWPLVRMGGAIVLVGSVFPSRAVSMLLEQIVRRCLSLRGVHNYSPRHLAAALLFLSSERATPFESLVAPWQPLESVNAALASPLPAGSLRLGIRPVFGST